ncbi:MAG TPA: type II secretion system protein [Phycisphaerae bacterium]|nr:type II secretion system protein [Phycisphaerae bacterium]
MNLKANHRLRRGRPAPAFTLIELLVVIAVITVLLAILFPSLGKAREDARRTVCLANLKHIGIGLFTYADGNNGNGPNIMTPMGHCSPRTLLSVPGAMVNLGLTLPTEVADPNLFRCPSQRQFNYATDPELFKTEKVTGSYAYAVQLAAEESPRFSRFRHLAMVSDDFTAPEDAPAGTPAEGVGRYTHRVAYNVLYTDGSAARYANTSESIWRRGVYWDDETDSYTYARYYSHVDTADPDSAYMQRYPDIFRVWHAFCYSQPDPFAGAPSPYTP